MKFNKLSYSFLGLLPAFESLSVRGRRLQETALQRRSKVYAPDAVPSVRVEAKDQRLAAHFTDSVPDSLVNGEQARLSVHIVNEGSTAIDEIWLVPGPFDELCLEAMPEYRGMLYIEYCHSRSY